MAVSYGPPTSSSWAEYLDPPVRVEGEHLLEQVQGLWVRVRVETGPGDLWLEW